MRTLTWLIAIVILFATGAASAKIDEAAIAAVKAGTRSEARAAWWGFDPADSTAALQAAIDSGARKVILEDMGSPWNTGPLVLAGDQELALAPGVVLQAKRGAFMRGADCLLSASGKKNVRITGGAGATVRMWRGDYARPPYTRSEFRHAITIKSCAGVTISGLSILESGGDGIYLGESQKGVSNTDVVIRDVICDRNWRQGISVITAERLLIENTVLRDTSGTAPMAGIDFEPNQPHQKLVDCVMRNCLIANNAGSGCTFYLKHQTAESAPISFRFENCRTVGNRTAFRWAHCNADPAAAAKCKVDVIGCSFEESQGAAIVVDNKPAEGCPMRFEHCRIVDAAREDASASPIQITTGADDSPGVGGVEFADCDVVDALERRPLAWRDLTGGVMLAGVSGALAVEHAGDRTVYTLDRELLQKWFPTQAFQAFAPFQAAGARWAPASVEAPAKGGWACPARLRERGEYLIWAEAGQEVAFTLRLAHVGTSGAKMAVTLIAPDGASRKLAPMTGDGEKSYTFKAAKTGACHLVCEPGRATVQVTKSTHRVCIYQERGRMHLLGSAGRLYFRVPAGVDEFGVRIGAGGVGESVKATVLDAAGKPAGEQDNIIAHQFLLKRPRGAGTETWSVRLERPSKTGIEDHYLQLQGLAPVLAARPEALIVAN